MNDDITLFEKCEMAAWHDFLRAAPDDIQSSMGIESVELDGALLSIVPGADVLGLNRVMGLGVVRAATQNLVEDAVNRYRAAGAKRFFVQVSPVAKPDGISRWLTDRGLSRYNNWVRLHRTTDSVPEIETPLAIRQIGREDAAAFGEIAAQCLGWPEEIGPVVAGTVGRPGWRHYMAFDGDIPAATGALYADGEIGWMDFAATRTEYRGKRAQKALAVRRIIEARNMGCREVIVEVAEHKPDKEATSNKNMMKLGFVASYKRPNYILELGQ